MDIAIECLCRDVQMKLTGEPLAHVYCHCDDCQRVHGGAYLPAAMYRTEQTSVLAGDPHLWKLKTTVRATCRGCGTRIFAEPPGLGIRSITAYLLPPGLFHPVFHMQCQHALLPIRDSLPHYKHYPALFGGTDEQMPW
jgi:hypothetical protein